MSVTALIVAAGRGERLGGGVPKQFRKLGGKAVLRWAVEPFLRHPAIRDVLVAGLVPGGPERSDSVRAGLDGLEADAVLIHDAARPFCPPAVIDRLIASLEFFEGAAPVLPVGDTLARMSDRLGEPIDREGL
ncbi:MAG TPA: 2-C-methyl-D-erythritol 4-phosphate cytidylyltransferase, partial [Sphingomicrobium sp.]|nr:2-C-methyl-D-erythritol 4-phosphate cytidylyltransferase [Sphingomicrobium sp.]